VTSLSSVSSWIVVMGVTGCGKTTLGTLLAQRLGMPYLEADDFHPAANKAKMQAKTPLTDEDRQPWLSAIAKRMAASIGPPPPVVSCSALKRQYRDLLRQADPRVWFLHLAIDEATATQWVKARPGTSCLLLWSPPSSPHLSPSMPSPASPSTPPAHRRTSSPPRYTS
jgi:gluconokinase